MSGINWSLLDTDAYQKGYEYQRGVIKRGKTENALARLSANPDDMASQNVLMRYEPDFAMKYRADRDRVRQEDLKRKAMSGAMLGDRAAMNDLAGLDPEMFMKLSDRGRKKVEELSDLTGQIALTADTPEKWDAMVQQSAQRHPEIGAYLGRFSERETFAAEAGIMKEFLAGMEPKYQVIPHMGRLVNTRDPEAVGEFGAQLQDQALTGELAAQPPRQMPSNGASFITKSNLAQLQRANPAKASQLMNSGTRVISDDASKILSDAKEAIMKGADPAVVEARAMQLLGIE